MFAINSYAVMQDITIIGNKPIEVGETVQLKVEYITSNDLVPPGSSNVKTGITNEEDITEKCSWKSENERIAKVKLLLLYF